MTVKRISVKSLNDILEGNTTEEATCFIKVYSNNCNYCHNLKDYYEDLAAKYEEMYFYAFNIEDDMSLETRLGFNGIPTIIKVKVAPPDSTVDILGDPPKPNKLTWYRSADIKNFIEETEND
jgi:thioredoxin-like negative regulator of GroEL